MSKPELLAPAGNLEKLEIAIHYGADAVYLAGKDFSLRNFAGNFSLDAMQRAISLAHDCDVKVYVTCNIYPRSHEAAGIQEFLASVNRMNPDGIIIFNSKDLCMIDHLPEMIQAGIASLKIEGRMKGIHYLATVLKAYREAIDLHANNPDTYRPDPSRFRELCKISHRGYCTGFYLGDPDQVASNLDGAAVAGQTFLAKVLSETSDGKATIDVRNRIRKHDRVEILSAHKPLQMDTIRQICNLDQTAVDVVHPGTRAIIGLDASVSPNDLIRKVDS